MALADLSNFYWDGPGLIFIGPTADFPADVNTDITYETNGNFLQPAAATYNTVLAAYTEGAVTGAREVSVTEADFNEFETSPARQLYKNEKFTLTFTSGTPLAPDTLQRCLGTYYHRRVSGLYSIDTIYGGNRTIAADHGLYWVAKQASGNPITLVIPAAQLQGNISAALQVGDFARMEMVFTAVASPTHAAAWWILNKILTADL